MTGRAILQPFRPYSASLEIHVMDAESLLDYLALDLSFAWIIPLTYELQMAQNPTRARMCGFGEKDRRPMDPPPIVRLIVKNEDGSLADVSQMDVNFYMLVADIYAVDKLTPCTLVTNPVSSTQGTSAPSAGQPSVESVMSLSSHLTSRNLTGSTVASGNLLTSLEGDPGVYFVFQDLSVRSEGAYTLKFSFTLPPTPDGPPSSVLATVFSEPFTIYSAKRFPGMTESTALSKCFAKQGIKIPIRKEPRVGRSRKSSEQSSSSTSKVSSPSFGASGDLEVVSESEEDDDGQG
ncbi:MAG: velvet factor-domain-containing protein [Benniella sp.]|nr:MAG: velvet factor-domain-containing protein [Benniella sp.]